MDRPKWYSKLIHTAVVLSVLLSLLGVAVVLVAAQEADLGVTVDTEQVRFLDGVYCVSETTARSTITLKSGSRAISISYAAPWDEAVQTNNGCCGCSVAPLAGCSGVAEPGLEV